MFCTPKSRKIEAESSFWLQGSLALEVTELSVHRQLLGLKLLLLGLTFPTLAAHF